MKNYTITVNGVAYDVTVEERVGGAAPAPAPAAFGAEGSVVVEAGAAGKVFSVDVAVGDSVKAGDPVVTLEVMKMETPIVAPQDGVIASINVTSGQMVEAGETLATMN